MRDAYDASASAWQRGPAPAYEALADVLVVQSLVPLRGARILDLGTGTGAATRAARRAGAGWVVGIDLAPAMLTSSSDWDAVAVADAGTLPFAADSFDLVVAACCLGHLPAPDDALVEARRVAGTIVASAFLAGWSHAAKEIVDTVATRHGFVVPDWYVRLKQDRETAVDEPDKVASLARAAGYPRVAATIHDVDVGVRTPAELSDWRLGMAHLAPFVASLTPAQRGDLQAECDTLLAGAPPLIVPLIVLSASG